MSAEGQPFETRAESRVHDLQGLGTIGRIASRFGSRRARSVPEGSRSDDTEGTAALRASLFVTRSGMRGPRLSRSPQSGTRRGETVHAVDPRVGSAPRGIHEEHRLGDMLAV
jgi:hypothetical protein